MDQCHILKLPAELRFKIYDYLLISNDAIRVHTMPATPLTPVTWDSLFRPHVNCECQCMRQTYRPDISLLLTCKTINNEATTVLYAKNRFTLDNGAYSPISPKNSERTKQALHMMASEWLMRLRPSTLALLRPVMENCLDRRGGGPATIKDLVVTAIDVQKLIAIIEDNWEGSLDSVPKYLYGWFFSRGMMELLNRPYDGTEDTHEMVAGEQLSFVRWKVW